MDGELEHLTTCGESALTTMLDSIDAVMNSDQDYIDALGNVDLDSSIVYDLFLTELNFCSIESSSEFIDSVNAYLISSLADFETYNYFTQREEDLLEEFFERIVDSTETLINLSPFYDSISTYSNDFYEDGDFFYTLLVIYEYSWCFWTNYVAPSSSIINETTTVGKRWRFLWGKCSWRCSWSLGRWGS